jgi:hypothetical protein
LACVFVLCWVTSAAQTNDYLDAYIVQVKPDKRAEFDVISKKIAAANRAAGDRWVAMETVYGDSDVVTYLSTRGSYADVEKGMGVFMGAMTKAYGEEGARKMFGDGAACTISSRSELRLRRWDLSSNVPKDPAAMAKLIGETRYLRTTIVHVRPGRTADFEAMVKEVKAAREKNAPDQVQFASQGVAGADNTVYYLTILKPSLGAFDSVPSMQSLLGEDGYQKWLKTNSEVVTNTNAMILRFVPELSSAPTEVAAASPDFWNPKPAMAVKRTSKKPITEAAKKQ